MQPISILMAAPTMLILFLSWTLQPVGAGVLDRIAEEGVMRAGTRASAAPFAWKTAAGTFEGFSVDLLKEFRAAAEKTAGRPVRLELFEVTPADRLQRVASQELDIVCGTVSFGCPTGSISTGSMLFGPNTISSEPSLRIHGVPCGRRE